ncbi:MAG: outer membrane protein assembly factor BamD [Myxococcaceae bacterium]
MKLSFLLPAVFLCGCASFGTFAGQDTTEVTFGADAEENMRKGNDAFESKNYQEAASYFEFVKTKYPYLELARTAELRLGDSDFEREKYAEARDRYQNFVRLHPTHARIDYAAFRAALTHYKEIPSDFFLLPPASEKDQVEVRNALSSMNDFVRMYPGSEHIKDAKKVMDEVKLRLAEHELYVADFYSNPLRAKWPAVIARLEGVVKNYSGIGLDEKIAFDLSDAYVKNNDPAGARRALERYAKAFPNEDGAKKALARAAELPAVNPAPAAKPDAGT